MKVDMWKEFRFGDLISQIYKSKALNKDDLIETADMQNGIRYITRTGENNGCEFIADVKGIPIEYIQSGNAISIGDTTATCFYQKERFITGDHMVIIRAEWLNEAVALFVLTILNKEQYKYSYGRAFLMDRIRNTILYLPIQCDYEGNPIIDKTNRYSAEGYIPDWTYMETYIKSLHCNPLTTHNKSKNVLRLNVYEWKYFFLKDICNITMGNKMDFAVMSMEKPSVNFVGRAAGNNGVAGKVDFVEDSAGNFITPYRAGCVTVALGGSLGATYLQMEDFYTSQNVSVLEFDKDVSVSAKLFIACCIMNECKYKYFPFGRELNTHIRTDFGFALPIQYNLDGTPVIDSSYRFSEEGYVPDWNFMENYMKSLPYGDRL